MMFFSTNWPKIGTFSENMSQPVRPQGKRRRSLMNSHRPMGIAGSDHQYLPT
jgi:hypothetical protein